MTAIFRNPVALDWGSVPDWLDDAQCRDDAQPDLFFTTAGTTAAKATCGRCPVAQECLRFALSNGLEFGVFGGLTEDERKAIRSRPRRPRPGFSVRR